jgi:hypothetical protein
MSNLFKFSHMLYVISYVLEVIYYKSVHINFIRKKSLKYMQVGSSFVCLVE